MGELWYNGKSLSDFGVMISGSGVYKTPERDMTRYEIEGKNGDIFVDNGRFENVEIEYPAFIPFGFDFKFDDFKAWLFSDIGYHKIEDTYHPDHFRMGVCYKQIKPKVTTLNRGGEFDIEFNCKPQLFLKSGDKPRDFAVGSISLYNPTLYRSKPIFELSAAGTITGDFGTFTVLSGAPAGEMIVVDCENEDVYSSVNKTNLNATISGDFPYFDAGNNTITAGMAIHNLKTRWWTI